MQTRFSIDPDLLAIEVLHCRNREFQFFFAAVTLPYIYELDPYPLKTKNERTFVQTQTYVQTDATETIIMLLRGW